MRRQPVRGAAHTDQAAPRRQHRSARVERRSCGGPECEARDQVHVAGRAARGADGG